MPPWKRLLGGAPSAAFAVEPAPAAASFMSRIEASTMRMKRYQR